MSKSDAVGSLLGASRAMADGIAALLFPYTEVVVHDTATQAIVYIANNISKRSIGDDSALGDLLSQATDTFVGPYEKVNWDGRKIRSASIVMRDSRNIPRYVVCININIAVFEEARHALDLFLSITKVQSSPGSIFKDDWQEKINTFLHAWLQAEQTSLQALTQKDKKQLVLALQREGAFQGRSAASYVANVLSMGRATVFKYIKEAKALQAGPAPSRRSRTA
jgi:D-arginine utilization repressor